MIDHTGLNISNPKKSREFYDKALAPLGYTMLYQVPMEHTEGKAVFGYGVAPKPDFWVAEGEPNKPHLHMAFRAQTRAQVDQFLQSRNGRRRPGQRQARIETALPRKLLRRVCLGPRRTQY